MPQYSGYAMNAAQVADLLFGGAVMCERDLQAEAQLDTVPYATTGAFTVNVWVQVSIPFADSTKLQFLGEVPKLLLWQLNKTNS